MNILGLPINKIRPKSGLIFLLTWAFFYGISRNKDFDI